MKAAVSLPGRPVVNSILGSVQVPKSRAAPAVDEGAAACVVEEGAAACVVDNEAAALQAAS